MGRFYTTAERDYQDDFIFQPDWQLAKESLLKQDADVASQIDSYDLLDNLDIKTWKDADGENAANVQERYSSKVDDLAKKLSTNLLDRNNKMALRSLQTELMQDRKSGEISKIEQNAAAYENFQAELAKRKNPADKQRYMRMVSDYMQESEGKGALGKIFAPDQMYDDRNIGEEFASSDTFKGMKASGIGKNIQRIQGEYYVTEGGKLVELSKSKVGNAMKTWMQGEGLQSYGADREKYAGQKWLDANGEISFNPGTTGGDALNGVAEALSYRDEETTRQQKFTEDAINQRQESRARAAQKEEFMSKLIGADVDAADAYEQRSEVREYEEKTLNTLNREMFMAKHNLTDADMNPELESLSKASQGNFSSMPEFVKQFDKPDMKEKYPLLYNRAITYQKEVKDAMKGSYASLANAGFDPDMIKLFEAKHNKAFEKNGETLEFNLMPMKYESDGSDGATPGDRKIIKPVMGGKQKYRPQDFIGKKVMSTRGTEEVVVNAELKKDSNVPVFLNGKFGDGKSLNDNFGTATIVFTFAPLTDGGEERTEVRKVTYSMKEIGVTY